MSDLLAAALDYRRRGLCIIPLGANKRPAVRWKRYQRERPSEATIRNWFDSPRPGMAVVFGEVSGGLASRDFDDMSTYESWARECPGLAETLPTVETRRGRHVYCTVAGACERAFRAAIGKPNGIGAVKCAGGELRIGVGCYSVLPPSIHPEGHVYRWLTSFEHFPAVDLLDSGLATIAGKHDDVAPAVAASCDQTDLGTLITHSPPCLEYSLSSLSSLLHGQTELAIQRTVPTTNGKRHRLVFEFARELKALAEFRDKPVTAFRSILREWHRRALPYIQTKAWEETWIDFVEGWAKVRNPKGEEPLTMLFTEVAKMPPPPEADQFDTPELKLLIGLCRELQRAAGSGPFYLSTRAAGGLLQRTHVQVSRWLKLLCVENILLLVSKGTVASGEASRYRYLGRR